MQTRSLPGWEPIDLPPIDPKEVKPIWPRTTWKPIDLSEIDSTPELPAKLRERLKGFPDLFREQAKKTWKMLCELDQDATKALQLKQTRNFVSQLASVGVLAMVHEAEASPLIFSNAPRAVDCLPKWLQPDFLAQQGLKPEPIALTKELETEVIDRYTKLMGDLPQRNLKSGRYFTLSGSPRECPQMKQYKYYIEGPALVEALRSGALERAIGFLKHLNLGLECKLFEGDRMVIYGKGDVAQSDRFLDVMTDQGIRGRGPAQDVWSLNKQPDGSIEPMVVYSNDQALGQGAKLPHSLDYPVRTYSTEAFMDWYLKLCSHTGKSPIEPYRTSFVHAVDPDAVADGGDFAKRAEKAAGYPVVVVKKYRKAA